jgi:sugar phosphate isomerase/epimerase
MSTVAYEGVALERALEGVKAAGFGSVVVGPSHEGRPTLDLAAGADGASSLAAALSGRGLEVHAIWPELSPAEDDVAEALGTVVAQAKALGAGEVWISGPAAFEDDGRPRREDDWRRDVDAFARNVRTLAARAAGAGVGLVLPTEPRIAGCGAEAEALLGMLGGEGAPPFRLAYNPGLVSYYTGVNPVRDAAALAGRVADLCVRDHSGVPGEADFPPVGAGQVDYIGVLDALVAGGFAGAVVLEHVAGSSPEELDRAAAAAFRFLAMLVKGR